MPDEITLFCWVQGDDVKHIFLVDVKLSDTVARLKKAIQAKGPSLKHVPAGILEPWKVSGLYWSALQI
jgi:hypothetical protein